jgi:hypothetical protein
MAHMLRAVPLKHPRFFRRNQNIRELIAVRAVLRYAWLTVRPNKHHGADRLARCSPAATFQARLFARNLLPGGRCNRLLRPRHQNLCRAIAENCKTNAQERNMVEEEAKPQRVILDGELTPRCIDTVGGRLAAALSEHAGIELNCSAAVEVDLSLIQR